MDDEQKNKLRQRLAEDIAACEADLVHLTESAKPIAPDRALGRLTRMDSMNDHGISKAALRQNQEKLYKLQQALEKIDQPGFGECTGCGQPIPIERLIALPESTRCVRCASGGH